VKPATKEVWRQGENGLVEFFGANKPLRDVTPGDADAYKLHLIGKKLAPMTVRKRLQFATMIFRAALRRRLIAESPFADVSIKASMPNREHFVTLNDTAKLLEACPDHNWRTIVALARYGGLRCPSEVLSLQWPDIDWALGRVVVQSPKTEHHPGKETRTIPLFPELRTILAEAFELAPEGAVYVVDERMRESSQGDAGWRNCNLRTTFTKIVRRAGLRACLQIKFCGQLRLDWPNFTRALPEKSIDCSSASIDARNHKSILKTRS
jgi:integrase